MRRAQYTRYALRLGPPARARPTAEAEPPDAPNPPAALAADPDDDWSGVGAPAAGPDRQALDYRAPAAVREIIALQPAGWQEDDDGRALVFWLEDGAEADAAVGAALKRIGARGRLEVSRERPGWEDAWRRFHKPHVIGRLYVRPPWYPARADLLDIVVEAGLAFGTGGHATTRQCLELIQTIPRGSFLDLGSGSGVVSFAALRLGFAPVCGIDIDPVAVHAAAGNAAMNDLVPTFLVGDVTGLLFPLPAAEVVVANIALQPILRLAQRWRLVESGAEGTHAGVPTQALGAEPPAHLLLSGLLLEQADEVLAAFPAFAELARVDDGTWLTLHLTRRA